MADKEDRNEDAVYKVDTVPPPDGDDDAYSAPTKIGPMASAVVNELIMAKSRESAEVKAASQAKPRVGGGEKEEALDENDIEAELAFPPPPKVPGAPPSTPKVSANPPPSQKPSSSPQVKTQPIVPLTPAASIKPASPTTSQAPASVARPSGPVSKPQGGDAPTGLPPTMLAGGAVAVLVVLGILYMLLKH